MTSNVSFCPIFPTISFSPNTAIICYFNESKCTINCVSANCTAGQYLDTANNVCIDCTQSSYQPEKWQTECKPCRNDKITDGEGKTSESDCVSEYLLQEWKFLAAVVYQTLSKTCVKHA